VCGVALERGQYGLRAVLQAPWSDTIRRRIQEAGIRELELNYAKGWKGDDLSFLESVSDLQVLKILDFKIKDIDPIHLLRDLRSLSVSTYCSSKIHFECFPHLEECSLEWRNDAASLFQCTTLRKLWLNSYRGSSTEPFANLKQLESLSIWNASIRDLKGLSELLKLRELSLARLPKLASLSGIESLCNLQKLEIDTCRAIRSIGEIRNLRKLRKLWLNNDGRIESLKPIRDLTELKSVLAIESTYIVDGDLSPLLLNKELLHVSFKNRRHYSHRREDFGSAYFYGATWERMNS
jgi:internalin A